jgi:ribulose-phosphate 3-epimerase
VDRAGLDILVEVDGGVTADTAPLCLDAGAHALVAGTAVFRGGPQAYGANIKALKAAGGARASSAQEAR